MLQHSFALPYNIAVGERKRDIIIKYVCSPLLCTLILRLYVYKKMFSYARIEYSRFKGYSSPSSMRELCTQNYVKGRIVLYIFAA
jgi:hypothetical protein